MSNPSILRPIKIFANFSDVELEELFACGEMITKAAHSHPVIEGEDSRGLYVLIKGTVAVYKSQANSKKLARLGHLEAGAYFGEISLFAAAPRSATVSTESPCTLFFIDFNKFQGFLDNGGTPLKARFYQRCAEEMAERFRCQNQEFIASQQLLWHHAFREINDPQASPPKRG